MAKLESGKNQNRKGLLEKLNKAVFQSKRHKVLRLIMCPRKMLYPKYLQKVEKSKEVCSHTFWGGRINLILPEAVSMRIWRYGFFEEDVCLYLINQLKEGMTFIDVGTHFGFFSLLGRNLVGETGRVLGFEPTPSTFEQLQKNIAHFKNIETQNCALYSEDTSIKFFDYGSVSSAYNSAFGTREEDNSDAVSNCKEIIVKAIKLDDLIEEKGITKVDVIKIDAESSEMHVLMGMSKTLLTLKPSIILEVGDLVSNSIIPRTKNIIDWLEKEVDYIPYEIRDGLIVPHIVKDQYEYGNLLFAPKNHLLN
jgi:FkbM family methyltransferase